MRVSNRERKPTVKSKLPCAPRRKRSSKRHQEALPSSKRTRQHFRWRHLFYGADIKTAHRHRKNLRGKIGTAKPGNHSIMVQNRQRKQQKKPSYFSLSLELGSERGNERANKWVQHSERAKRAVRGKPTSEWCKLTSERCKQMSRRTSEWPSTNI